MQKNLEEPHIIKYIVGCLGNQCKSRIDDYISTGCVI